MIALLSDVHANLEALQAVIEDLNRRGISRVFFLGDIVGYGPNPWEVLEYTAHFEQCLLGNHDEACLTGPPTNFNELAQRGTWWTRRQICPDDLQHAFFKPTLLRKRKQLWAFLRGLKPALDLGELLFVHDTPADPGSWRYVRKRPEADLCFQRHPAKKAMFFGHSHVPGVWYEDRYVRPESGEKFDFSRRVLVNIGSVGQPRDGDARACYVLLENDGFRFIRVPYNLALTQAKILATPDLDNYLAQRLAEGK